MTQPSTSDPAARSERAPRPTGAEAEILVAQEGAVGTITLNRPAVHNALRYAMWRDLAMGVRELAGRAEIRAIVVRGAGERAFSAGADIAEFPERRGTAGAAAEYHAAVEDALGAIGAAAQPVIAMIHGYCIGGGCELAIACDLRIADDQARFGIPAAKLGVILGLNELRQLLALVGPATAKDILLTGRLLGVDEALRVGLVDRVVLAADLAGTVAEAAAQIVANAPVAVAATKALIAGLARGDDEATLTRAHATFVRDAFASADHGEGARAFLEGRRPRFGGR